MTIYPNNFSQKSRAWPVTASTGLVALGLLVLGTASALAQEATPVTSCGVTFDLPAHLRISKPRRSVNEQGVAECVFAVLPAKASARNTVCRDKEEGGSPPYRVCDWTTDGVPEDRVVVAQTTLARDKKAVGAFVFSGNVWQLDRSAVAVAEPVFVDFFGKTAFQIEANYKTWWQRTKVKHYTSDFAGTASATYVLVQLAPGLAVSLEPPPGDTQDVPECTVFCASLRPAAQM